MKTVNVELTEEQLQMVMKAMSHFIADLVNDDGDLLSFPFIDGEPRDYFNNACTLYFQKLNPLQAEF